MDYIRITKENIDKEHICCAMSGKQCLAKKEWLKQRFDEGLVFCRSVERGKCFIEYIPAENAWLPMEAEGCLHINCLWGVRACVFCLPRGASANFWPTPGFWRMRAFPRRMCPTAASR